MLVDGDLLETLGLERREVLLHVKRTEAGHVFAHPRREASQRLAIGVQREAGAAFDPTRKQESFDGVPHRLFGRVGNGVREWWNVKTRISTSWCGRRDLNPHGVAPTGS